MEMVFNSDEGIITSSEEIKLKIGIDDIMYYPIDYDSMEDIKLIHFNDLLHGFIFINKEKCSPQHEESNFLMEYSTGLAPRFSLMRAFLPVSLRR